MWGVKFPDYSKPTALAANTAFVAPSNGWIMGEVSAAVGGYCQIKVNNIIIQQVGSEAAQRCRGPFSAPVQAGQTVLITVAGNAMLPLANFFPEI